jgi:hypothetical protein
MEKTMLAGFDQHWATSPQDDGFIGNSWWRGVRLEPDINRRWPARTQEYIGEFQDIARPMALSDRGESASNFGKGDGSQTLF